MFSLTFGFLAAADLPLLETCSNPFSFAFCRFFLLHFHCGFILYSQLAFVHANHFELDLTHVEEAVPEFDLLQTELYSDPMN